MTPFRDRAVEVMDAAWEEMAARWTIRQIGTVFVVYEEVGPNEPMPEFCMRFYTHAEAVFFKRRKCLTAALDAYEKLAREEQGPCPCCGVIHEGPYPVGDGVVNDREAVQRCTRAMLAARPKE